MFYTKGAAVKTYVSTESSPRNRTFNYMNAYNSITTKSIPNCYYYAKGV